MLTSAVVVYFIIMTQMLYPMTLAVYAWTTKSDPIFYNEPTLDHFSTAHVAIFMLVLLTIICWNAELGFFMQISSAGVVFLIILIVYIVQKGFEAFSNSDFKIGSSEESLGTDWQTSLRTITLVNDNYAPAAGIFCAGYFLHVIGVPILKNAK